MSQYDLCPHQSYVPDLQDDSRSFTLGSFHSAETAQIHLIICGWACLILNTYPDTHQLDIWSIRSPQETVHYLSLPISTRWSALVSQNPLGLSRWYFLFIRGASTRGLFITVCQNAQPGPGADTALYRVRGTHISRCTQTQPHIQPHIHA